jgi:O-antigen ligase
VLLTFSSGAWLGALASSVAVLLVLGYRRFAFSLGLLGVLALAVVSALALAGVLPERFNPLRQAGVIRIDLWLSSLAMLRDHPLFGVGLDNFTYLYQQVYIREGGVAEPNLSHPHNWLLHFWLELGLLGLLAFLWLVATFFRLALQARTWLTAGLIGAMTATLVHGLIDQSYFLVDLAFIFWLLLGLAVARPERE